MRALRTLTLCAILMFGPYASKAPAASGGELRCLPKEQQQALIDAGKAVGLAIAIKAALARVPGEVVRAQLCEQQGGGLVYLLTVLARNGKVKRVEIAAADGAYAGER